MILAVGSIVFGSSFCLNESKIESRLIGTNILPANSVAKYAITNCGKFGRNTATLSPSFVLSLINLARILTSLNKCPKDIDLPSKESAIADLRRDATSLNISPIGRMSLSSKKAMEHLFSMNYLNICQMELIVKLAHMGPVLL